MKSILFLALVLTSTAYAAGVPCGLTGTVAQRIQNCHETAGVDFQLVTRTKEGFEIFKGRRTGVIWSADLGGPKNYLKDKISSICKTNRPEFGGLTDLKWILPEAPRFLQGLKYNIQDSLPLMRERDYWTSTSDSFYVNSRFIFEGGNQYTEDEDGNYRFSELEIEDGKAHVKCIVETI